ncbi:hypothetical protein B0H19DRAFT_1158158 [Mycena capillaripes]|nr:hypothetical protein B0H19DRAFT_1158158 [Mycena capillaripes]
MFQFLRMRSEFGALSGEDRFLLGTLVPPEEIVVEEMDGANEPFSVKFRIPQFLKRMSLSRKIKLEFIARGRLWNLSFFTAVNPTSAWLKNGGWSASLAITDSSPSTHAEFGLVCLDPRPSPPALSANFWVHCSSDKPLYIRGEPGQPKDGITGWSWPMFER